MSAEKSETMVMETSQETEIRTKDMNGKDLRQVGNFKYLGTEVESEGGTLRAVKQRIKAAWMKWCEMAGVICDKGTPKKIEKKDIQSGSETSADVWGRMLDNEEERRGLNAKNRDADAAMDSGGFQEG